MAELDKNKLIKEEQKIVDELIKVLEDEIEYTDKRLKNIIINHRRAKEQGPDAYGLIVEVIGARKEALNEMQRAQKSKDELYTCRLILECDDGVNPKEEIEVKVGYSNYFSKDMNILIYDWKREVCRHFLLDNCVEEYIGTVTNKYGEIFKTHYTLKMKRLVDIRFAFVRDVTHLFPLTIEEAQRIIYDAFLSELASRRDNAEFKNIIFSIQKKQGEIIKLPYDENIIVQGCAGSGKSMIMLHRLPILVYDNPDVLNSSNIYIISPSETYIQMVDNMREELEITDLKMGTLNQYYDHVLSKYGIDLEIYGRVSYATKVTTDQEKYIYSKQLTSDIQEIVKESIYEKKYSFIEGLTIFGLDKREKVSSTIDAKISDYIILGNNIINANNKVLKSYFDLCKVGILSIKDIVDKVKNRRTYILRNIAKQVNEHEEIIKQKLKELEDTTLGEKAIKNREDAIENSRNSIFRYAAVKEQIEKDDEYFNALIKNTDVFNKLIYSFEIIKLQYEENSRENIYKLLHLRKNIYKTYRQFVSEISEVEEKYDEFADNLVNYVDKFEHQLVELLTKNDVYLDADSFEEVIEATMYYTNLKENLAKNIYLKIMEKCGQVPDEKGKIKGLQFSSYLYLKIMYEIKGTPNVAKEKLVCIDEAQVLEPEELKLIRAVNGDKLILNLYGDVKQHIEGTKGIDSWDEFGETIRTPEILLMENYRNASQITEECNRRFNMQMKAINTPGSGVKLIRTIDEFDEKMHNILLSVHKPGIRAIIVNDVDEARQIISKYSVYQDKLYDMTQGQYDFHRTRWNVLTVEQAKGIEFGTVIAISGRMTPNKKYIAFTRALDELFIFDFPLQIDNYEFDELKQEDKSLEKKIKSQTKETKEKKVIIVVDYSKSQVRKYFESKGLEVNDMRDKGGALWVIGEQAKIKQFVDEACEKFGISGTYSSGKATGYRAGCYFKTKK